MFVLNYTIGSLLVHPDWDEHLRQCVRYSLLAISCGSLAYYLELKELIDIVKGIAYV